MSFDDRLRSMFQTIDERVALQGLDWDATIRRARRSRTIYLGSVVVGTVTVLTLGAVGARAVLLSETNGPLPGPAATEGSASPTPTPSPTPGCSGERDYSTYEFQWPVEHGLPEAVRDTMIAILEAARTCDYEELERIADVHRDAGFNYTQGGGDQPARYWRRLENENDPKFREEVTSIMITLLTMNHAVDCYSASIGCAPGEQDLYIWPRVAGPNPDGGAVWNRAGSDEDRQELVDVGLYTQEEVDQMREAGSGYLGYRIGILKGGDWLYFIAGD